MSAGVTCAQLAGSSTPAARAAPSAAPTLCSRAALPTRPNTIFRFSLKLKLSFRLVVENLFDNQNVPIQNMKLGVPVLEGHAPLSTGAVGGRWSGTVRPRLLVAGNLAALSSELSPVPAVSTSTQGLTLVHSSAQREHVL
jgi:hypothetical protein